MQRRPEVYKVFDRQVVRQDLPSLASVNRAGHLGSKGAPLLNLSRGRLGALLGGLG